MKIERLRNKRSKLIFLCGFVIVVVLLITVVIQGSRAKYRSSQFIELISNKAVTNKVPDFTVMGIYLNDGGPVTGADGKKYTKQGNTYTMPGEGYVINEANSYCEKFNSSKNISEKDTNVKLYTDKLGNNLLKGLSQGDKCHIFFDKGFADPTSIKAELLTKWGYSDITTITERTDIGKIREDTGNVVYKAQDDDGWTYYLVGNPTKNWVKFGGYYWRIVRINGDGSLRMIYQGRTKDESGNNLAPQTTGAETQIKTSPYNPSKGAEYVGYFYTLGEQRGLGTPSIVYGVVNDFYTKIGTEEDRNYIDKNAGFCNDRSTKSGTAVGRVEVQFKRNGLKCPNDNDLFTSLASSKGNKKLQYPIGLITSEEILKGGASSDWVTPSNTFFTTNKDYWTITPTTNSYIDWAGDLTNVMVMRGNGMLQHTWATEDISVKYNFGVRPVINLVKNITFKGDGTTSNPFEIN